MSFSLFSKKEKGEVVVIYDIGSASIGGALVLIENGVRPKIMYQTRKEISFQKELNFNNFTKSMERSLLEVSTDLQKNGLPHLKFTKFGKLIPKKVYCILASPWYASQTRIIKSQTQKEAGITKKRLDDLVEIEIKNFLNSRKIIDYVGDDKTKIIEKRITQIKLNGYKTSSPFDKKFTEFEASLSISITPQDTVDIITKKIHDVFLTPRIEFYSFSSVAYDTLRDIKQTTNDFIFLDISGELTDISLIKDDVFLETASFPMGKNDVIRSVMDAFRINKNEASSLMTMYSEKKLNETQTKKMDGVFIEIEKKWVSLFQNILVKFSRKLSIPNIIFFVSDKDIEKIFNTLIRNEQFGQFTMTNGAFSVNSIYHQAPIKQCAPPKDEQKDIFIILEAIFVNKILQDK